MNEKPSAQGNRTRRKRKNINASPVPYFIIISAVVIAGFVYFKYQHNNKPTVIPEVITTPASTTDSTSHDTESYAETFSHPVESESKANLIERPVALTTTESTNESAIQFETIKESAHNDKIWAESQRALTNLELFYSHLDKQEYMQPTLLNTPSKVYFTQLIQKMLDNPPIVSGETDDLFNILQNTAHFFRIVGKENIFSIKAILFKEKSSFEEVLADYYALTKNPDYLYESFALKINSESLYDYAGFFLTTMGGRLYLFRRDSVSRMVVSYYSILIIDDANTSGTNRHGIDIKPAISTLINEFENSSAQLKLKDTYLDTLYDLKEKYL